MGRAPVGPRRLASSPPLPRRAALAAAAFAAAGLAAGCAAISARGVGALGTPPGPLPDVAVLRDAIAGERVLIARYRAVLAREPAMGGLLSPILAEHQAHLTALSARLVDPRAARSPAPSASPPTPPPGPAADLAWLRGAERAFAGALLSRLGPAPPSLAQLMASIAASELTHAAALGASLGRS